MNSLAGSANSTPSQGDGSQSTVSGGSLASQGKKELNVISLCRMGQETVQDIVSSTLEMFNQLKSIQLPSNASQMYQVKQEREIKLNEMLQVITGTEFKKLRLIYTELERFPSSTPDQQQLVSMATHANQGYCESKWPLLMKERQEMEAKLNMKNDQLYEIMAQLRNLIWDINGMLAIVPRT